MNAIRLLALAGLLSLAAPNLALADRIDRGLDWNNYRNDWYQLGEGSFSYRSGSRTVDSVRGRDIRALGLRPDGGDASCSQILVRFANGNRVSLDVGNLDYMRDGKLYRVDLPGNRRDVLRVAYTCRAEGGRIVDILLYVNR
jgi:hypothetical protein